MLPFLAFQHLLSVLVVVFIYLNYKALLTCVEIIELWLSKKKIIRWEALSSLQLDINQFIDSDWLILTYWYRLVWLNDLSCLTIIRKNEHPGRIWLRKSDFVRFSPHPYARTQQSLPHLWAAINVTFEKSIFISSAGW